MVVFYLIVYMFAGCIFSLSSCNGLNLVLCRKKLELLLVFVFEFMFQIGVDTDAIIMLIAARSNKQRQEIAQKYQSLYGKVIPVNL
jgi:hypothetical protein